MDLARRGALAHRRTTNGSPVSRTPVDALRSMISPLRKRRYWRRSESGHGASAGSMGSRAGIATVHGHLWPPRRVVELIELASDHARQDGAHVVATQLMVFDAEDIEHTASGIAQQPNG